MTRESLNNPQSTAADVTPAAIGAEPAISRTGATAGQVLTYSGAGLTLAPPVGSGPTVNLNLGGTKRARAGIAAVRAGVGPMRLFCAGDSTTARTSFNRFDLTYPVTLAKLLNTYVAPAAMTWMMPKPRSEEVDPRATLGAGWTTQVSYWKCTTASAVLSFAPNPSAGIYQGPPSVDTFDIYAMVYTGTGTATVNIDGGATLATIAAGATGGFVISKTTVTATAGTTHVLNITTSSATQVFITAVNAYLSTAPSIQVCNYGYGTTTATTWANPGDPSGYRNMGVNYAPHLMVIDLGINDAQAGTPRTPAQFSGDMQTILTAVLPYGDVLLKSMAPTQAGPIRTVEDTYQPILNSLAISNNCPLLDQYTRWTSWEVSNPLGYYLDAIHQTPTGGADIAQGVTTVLRNL